MTRTLFQSFFTSRYPVVGSISLSVGSLSGTFGAGNSLRVHNSPVNGTDIFAIDFGTPSFPALGSAPVGVGYIWLLDYSGTALSSDAAPTSIDIAAWDDSTFLLVWGAFEAAVAAGHDQDFGDLGGTINVTTVPDAGSALQLLGMAFAGLTWFSRKLVST